MTTSLILAGGAVSVALAAAALARTLPRTAAPSLHGGPLQGLRGLLALGIFLHHTLLWFHYTHGSGWSDSSALGQFGNSRVILFFMLASTLFYGRLLDARGGSLDWLRLYVSRLLRLAPLYWVAMGLMFAVLAVATVRQVDGAGMGIVLRSWADILGASSVWLGFSMLGTPAIDAYMNTPLITAGATWTMPFEITFYLLLPLLALPLGVRMPKAAAGIGLASVVWLAAWMPDARICLPFVGGMAVALLIRVPRVVSVLRRPASGAGALAAMILVIFACPSAYDPIPFVLQALFLAVVASGNDLFGTLRWRFAHLVGRCSYSLYLLHGIALYTLLLLVIGAPRAAVLSPLQFAVLIGLFAPVMLAIAWASQRWIEAPSTRAAPFVVAGLRRLGTLRPWSPTPRPAPTVAWTLPERRLKPRPVAS